MAGRLDYTLDTMAPGPNYKLDDPELRGAYLAALSRCGDVAPAAAAVGIARSTVYDHMKRDPQFAEECERATGRLLDAAMKTAKMLAVDGVLERTYDKDGNVVRERRVYSERILLKLLGRHMPEWGDKVAIDQTVRGEVEHTHSVQPKDLSRSARSRVRDLLDELPDPSTN